MIDLRESELPHSLDVSGKSYELDTGFRTWIAFERAYRVDGIALLSIFKGRRPPLSDRSWIPDAVRFLDNPNATPRAIGRQSGERALDMVLDGEYIVASFQHAYGIDLTDPELDMHWHRFKALLHGLPDETKLSKIVGYRSWTASKRKPDDISREMKQVWRLPEDGEEEAMREAQDIAAKLYEMQNGGA